MFIHELNNQTKTVERLSKQLKLHKTATKPAKFSGLNHHTQTKYIIMITVSV